MIHIPVLQKEVIQYLNPKPNENFIDATIGEAGHTLAILERNKPEGKVLGIEWDTELYKNLSKLDINRLILVNDSYVNLKGIVEREKFKPVSGILFDLGLSSWHLEKSGRGFSFQKDEPLDMRYNIVTFGRSSKSYYKLTAEEIVNKWSKEEIERILRNYGQELFAKRIAKEIVNSRKIEPIKTTFQLVGIIKKATPSWYWHPRTRTSSVRGRQKIHFATRTFQALRIAVNDELNNLQKALPQTLEILKSRTRAKLSAGLTPHRNEISGAGLGGRLVVISFHSLEDRIVKNFLKEYSQKGFLKILTKKPITPSLEEIKINPRSRSAKLRAALKIASE